MILSTPTLSHHQLFGTGQTHHHPGIKCTPSSKVSRTVSKLPEGVLLLFFPTNAQTNPTPWHVI